MKLRPSVLPPASVAIMRFDTAAGGDREEGLALSLAENLKVALIATGKVDVLDLRSIHSKDPATAARSVLAETYLTGKVQTTGGVAHASIAILRVADGRPLWNGAFDGSAGNWFPIEDRAAGDLLSALWRELPVVQHHTADPEADQIYWRGRFAMEAGTRQALRNAGALFQESAEKDQANSLAWAGLADASLLLSEWDPSSRLGLMPRVRVVANRAIELDPTIAEPHTALGLVAENYDWDWSQASHELKRATDLNPTDAFARLWYGEFLVQTGKSDDGFTELKRAAHLEPLSPLVKAIYAKCLYLARRYDEAIAMARGALLIDNDSFAARKWLVASYFQKSDLSNFADELVRLGAPATPLAQAAAAVGSGNRDKALEFLEQSLNDRESGLISVKTDPAFDPLRTDPRFGSVLSRMRLH